MEKKILLIIVVALFAFGISKLSFAMMCGANTKMTYAQINKDSASSKAVDVGNKICPVSGEKIDEKLKATYEYEGKIYNFCCAACIEEFKKDPQKYIKKVEEELQAELKEQPEHKEHEMEMMQESKTIHQGMHQGHRH